MHGQDGRDLARAGRPCHSGRDAHATSAVASSLAGKDTAVLAYLVKPPSTRSPSWNENVSVVHHQYAGSLSKSNRESHWGIIYILTGVISQWIHHN
jgi:hypothetical protein